MKNLTDNGKGEIWDAVRGYASSLNESQIATLLIHAGKHDEELIEDLMGKLSPEKLAEIEPNLPAESSIKLVEQAAYIAMNRGDLETAKQLLAGTATKTKEAYPIAELTVELFEIDPQQAREWVESLPASEAKQSAMFNLASNWAKTDLAASTAWVQEMPASSNKDALTKDLVAYHALSGDHRSALALTKEITNENDRLHALADATRLTWFQNPAQAKEIFSKMGLTAEQTSQVEKDIQRGFARR